MSSEQWQLVPSEFDAILKKLEAGLIKVNDGQCIYVKLKKAEWDFLEQIQQAHRFMAAVLPLRGDRKALRSIFGGDCSRISLTRAILDAARTVSEAISHDQRFSDCFTACECIESVLQDLGFAYQLQRSHEEQTFLLQRRRIEEGSHDMRGPEYNPTSLFTEQHPTWLESAGDSGHESDDSGPTIMIDLLGHREVALKVAATHQQEDRLGESMRLTSPAPHKELPSKEDSPISEAMQTPQIPSAVQQSEEVIGFALSKDSLVEDSRVKLVGIEVPMVRDVEIRLQRNLEQNRDVAPDIQEPTIQTKQLLQIPVPSATPWRSPRSASRLHDGGIHWKAAVNEGLATTPRSCTSQWSECSPSPTVLSTSTGQIIVNGILYSPSLRSSAQGRAVVSPRSFQLERSPLPTPSPRRSIVVPIEVVKTSACGQGSIVSSDVSAPLQEPVVASAGLVTSPSNREAPTLLQQISGMQSRRQMECPPQHGKGNFAMNPTVVLADGRLQSPLHQ
mmetsp:Transcript_113428/g.177306  ORF Transcript_113428/g.177306 Transcript_113428/m.177306 type:complete len:504 (+) Transcript_113428:71-1582(+)